MSPTAGWLERIEDPDWPKWRKVCESTDRQWLVDQHGEVQAAVENARLIGDTEGRGALLLLDLAGLCLRFAKRKADAEPVREWLKGQFLPDWAFFSERLVRPVLRSLFTEVMEGPDDLLAPHARPFADEWGAQLLRLCVLRDQFESLSRAFSYIDALWARATKRRKRVTRRMTAMAKRMDEYTGERVSNFLDTCVSWLSSAYAYMAQPDEAASEVVLFVVSDRLCCVADAYPGRWWAQSAVPRSISECDPEESALVDATDSDVMLVVEAEQQEALQSLDVATIMFDMWANPTYRNIRFSQ